MPRDTMDRLGHNLWKLFLLSLSASVHCGGTAEPVYGLTGKEVQLDPNVTETITSIIWKKNSTGIFEGGRSHNTVYYSRCAFPHKCEGNITSGVLILKDLKAEDEGRYTAEINHEGAAKEFQLIVLKPVSKPNVMTSCGWAWCSLSCVGQESQYTRYSWKENNETVKEGNTLMVEKSGDQNKSYTCVFSNPKSEEHSDPLTEMDLFPGSGLPPIIIIFIVGAAELLIIGLVAVAVIYFYKTK